MLRLNEQLQKVEPGPIVDDRAVGDPETVWAHGSTIWVAATGGEASLVCFVFRYDREIKATIKTVGTPRLLAATADMVFVVEKGGITGYSVPAACR